MKHLISCTLILICFILTTLMVGCGPSSDDKRQRIQKGRFVSKKTIPINQKEKNTPSPTSEAINGPTSKATNDHDSKKQTQQIDEFLTTVNNENHPLATYKQIPQGSFKLFQIVSTANNTLSSSRALLSVRILGNDNHPSSLIFIKDDFFTEGLWSKPVSSDLALPYQIDVEENSKNSSKNSKITLKQIFHYSMKVENKDTRNILIHHGKSLRTAANPLLLLKPEFENITDNVFVGTDGPEKGLKLYVRLTSKDEIRLIVDMPTDSILACSFILIYKLSSSSDPNAQ